MTRKIINKKYSFDEIVEWYQNCIKKIPHDPNELGTKGYISEEQLMELFTGKYYIQERLKGEVVVAKGTEHGYQIHYDSDMSHPVDKVQVATNNITFFKKFAGKDVNKPSSVTYPAPYYSEDEQMPNMDYIYEILNRYLEKSSLHNDNNKTGIVVKNYRKSLFGEYLKSDMHDELILGWITRLPDGSMDFLTNGFNTFSEEELKQISIYLLERISKVDLEKIKIAINQNPEWHAFYHHGLGTHVRTALRKGDFTNPLIQNSMFLDDNWHLFLLKAIEYSV